MICEVHHKSFSKTNCNLKKKTETPKCTCTSHFFILMNHLCFIDLFIRHRDLCICLCFCRYTRTEKQNMFHNVLWLWNIRVYGLGQMTQKQEGPGEINCAEVRGTMTCCCGGWCVRVCVCLPVSVKCCWNASSLSGDKIPLLRRKDQNTIKCVWSHFGMT